MARYRKYNFNQNYFESIDTEQKAYFLGLLMADGYIGNHKTVGISLKNDDKNILQKLLIEIDGEIPLGSKKNNTQTTLYICSKKMVEDLNKLGMTKNKTFTLKFPNLKKELIRHFIRGYFDGDGYIGERQCTLIISSKEFLESFLEYFKLNFGKDLYFHQIKNSYRVNLNKRDIDIVKYIYSNSKIYLERKYDNYKKYWEIISKE